MAHPENLEEQLKTRNKETGKNLRFVGYDFKSTKLNFLNANLKD